MSLPQGFAVHARWVPADCPLRRSAVAQRPWGIALRHLPRGCWLVLCVLLLVSCASVDVRGPVDDPQAEWRAHRAVLEDQRNWHASGRIGYRSQSDGWSAGFRWTQHEDAFEIRLSGALGTKRVKIRGDGNSVYLRTSEGREVRSTDATSLVSEELGVAVPVLALRSWLVGLPGATSSFSYELDEAGRLDVLRQAGWEVRYSEYLPVGNVYLPSRVVASRAPHEIKMVVREWTFLPAVQAAVDAGASSIPGYVASARSGARPAPGAG